jgi:cyclophilin family peptidyl-prolyl cis-trans isomerase
MSPKVSAFLILILCGVVFLAFLQRGKNEDELKKIESTVATPTSGVSVSLPQKQPTDGEKPMQVINTSKNYIATLKTDAGDIAIELFAKKTPATVNNFVSLAKKKFYDKTIFHRVIKGFMIQGGDPKGDGTGGPGYRFEDEKFDGEYERGTVAMANAGPNTNGSQFFIMQQKQDLPKNYVIFGKVIAGIDVVDKIASASVTTNEMGEPSKPTTPTVVKTVEITEK